MTRNLPERKTRETTDGEANSLRHLSARKAAEIAAAADAVMRAKQDGLADVDARAGREPGIYTIRDFDGIPGLDEATDMLAAAVEALSDPEFYELVGLMWLGRNDGDDLSELVRAATSMIASRNYVTGNPYLGEYLRAGLARLGAQ